MSLEQGLAFAVFAFVSSITPGPNNLMLLASGLNFGLRRTVPHILGIGAGFALLLGAVGLGLAELLLRWPLAYAVLKWAGAAYLLLLALRIARAGRPDPAARSEALGFWAAAAFQWVNPKAWIMAVAAYTTYAEVRTPAGVLAVALGFALINLPCLSTWALLGSRLRGWMAQGRRQQAFNIGMAALLVASLLPLLSTAQSLH